MYHVNEFIGLKKKAETLTNKRMALMNVLLMYMYTHVQLNLAQATCYTSYSLLILSQRERKRESFNTFFLYSITYCMRCKRR